MKSHFLISHCHLQDQLASRELNMLSLHDRFLCCTDSFRTLAKENLGSAAVMKLHFLISHCHLQDQLASRELNMLSLHDRFLCCTDSFRTLAGNALKTL